jgi:hypothetical protein
VLELVQVPFVAGVTLDVLPIQTVVDPPNTGGDTEAFITTFDEGNEAQLELFVTVNV